MPEFSGFPPQAAARLSQLAANNNRDWFQAHRQELQVDLETPAQSFVRAVEAWLGSSYSGKVFRFPRDLRFSKDKTPYNPNLRIGFTAPMRSGYYFSLEPERLTLGAGVFEFESAALQRFREAVAGAPGETLAGLLEGFRVEPPELVRLPAGWSTGHPRAELLRRKSLSAWHDGAVPAELFDRRAVAWCTAIFERLKPVSDWLEGVLYHGV